MSEKVTIQFYDGNNKKIIIGESIREDEYFIKVQCENSVYDINKKSCDWIKRSIIRKGLSNKEKEKLMDDFKPSPEKKIMMMIIEELGDRFGKTIPIEDVLREADKKINGTHKQIEELLERLKVSGDIFEPRRGFMQKI